MRKPIVIVMMLLALLAFGPVPAFAQSPGEQDSPFAPYSFDLTFPAQFGGGTFVKDLFRAEGLSVATAVADSYGTLFYIISDRDTVLAGAGVADWEDLETETYPFYIYGITPSGIPFVFAWGTLPLKAYPAGLMFDPAQSGRLLIVIRTLAIDAVNCGFLILDGDGGSATTEPQSPVKSSTLPSPSPSTGAWDLTGLEQCFYEKASIIQVGGQFEALPQIVSLYATGQQ